MAKYLGGTGYAAWLMWSNLRPKVDPLSQDNLMIFCTGPLTGTLVPCSGSYDAVFKSPLTGLWGESRSGGSFGPRMKFAGFDFIIVEGRAGSPVYVWVNDGEAEVRPASDLWGKGVHEATRMILEEVGDPNASVACIGPAGEKLVRFASIINDFDRAAGRCGGGAVMGSKNLKAVAVNGSGEIRVAKPEAFEEALKEVMDVVKKFKEAGVFAKYGTSGIVNPLNAAGAFPTKNFQTCYFENADKISGETLAKRYLIKRRACFSCPIGCGRYTRVGTGKYVTPAFEGPEYETIGALGALSLVDDLEAIIAANYLCNDYGMDTISTGVAIAFSIEAYEKGIIDKSFTGGLELKWGDGDVLIRLIREIGSRGRGLGNLLAEGVKRASEKLGDKALEIAVHVKGLETPEHDPRGTSKSFAIQYAVGNRGGCHTHPNWSGLWDFGGLDCGLRGHGLPWPPISRFDEEEAEKRAKAIRLFLLHGVCIEILGLCRFIVEAPEERCVTPRRLAALTSTLTGMDVDEFGLMRIAERAWTLQRCFNVREGVRRRDDRLPKRLLEPVSTGPTRGEAIKRFDGLMDAFYKEAGWDPKTGIPTKEKLMELGLGDVAETLPAE